MVLGHEAPVARVGRVVAVVAHHPVVVHGEGIAVGGFSVNIDGVVFHFQVMQLVGVDDTFVEWQVLEGELDGLSLLGNLERTVVVDVPWIKVGTVREDFKVGAFTGRGVVAFHRGDEGEPSEFFGDMLADIEDGLVGTCATVGLGDVVFVSLIN